MGHALQAHPNAPHAHAHDGVSASFAHRTIEPSGEASPLMSWQASGFGLLPTEF
jgi:hypothetical protein